MVKSTEFLKTGDALLIIDVQIDFCRRISLIEDGDQIVPVLNEWIEAARVKEILMLPVTGIRTNTKKMVFILQDTWGFHCRRNYQQGRALRRSELGF